MLAQHVLLYSCGWSFAWFKLLWSQACSCCNVGYNRPHHKTQRKMFFHQTHPTHLIVVVLSTVFASFQSFFKESPVTCHYIAFISRLTKSILMCWQSSEMHQYSRRKLMLTWQPESSNISRDDFWKYVFLWGVTAAMIERTLGALRFWKNNMDCLDLMPACIDQKQKVPEHCHGCIIDLSEFLWFLKYVLSCFDWYQICLFCFWTKKMPILITVNECTVSCFVPIC